MQRRKLLGHVGNYYVKHEMMSALQVANTIIGGN